LFSDLSKFKQDINPRNPNDVNYSTVIDAKIVDTSLAPTDAEQFKDVVMNLSLSTAVYKGQRTSKMATLMAKMGVKVQAIGSVLKLAKTLHQWIVAKEPTVYCEVNWRASYKEGEDKDVKDWKNLYFSWEQFPKDPVTGEPLERFEYQTKNGPRMISAQAYISDVFGTINNVPNEKKHRAGAAKPAQPQTRVAATNAPVSNAAPVAAGNAGGGATEDLFGNL